MLKGFEKLTYTYEALQNWFNELKIERGRSITIPTEEALNRVLAEDVVVKEDVPRFDRSAVDGFAVRAEDTNGATQFKPLLFRLTEEDEIKESGPRMAKQMWTGNSLPKGANACVMLENTKKKGEKIEIWVQAAPYDNVSRKGEDIKKGEVAVETGIRLNSFHLGLLSAMGNAEVTVVDPPKVAILATGSELVKVGETRGKKQIFESNRTMLSGMCCEIGAIPLDLGLVKDDVVEISERIRIGLKVADAIITTGGTSVGSVDLVPEAVNKIGKPGVIVHGIALRPAMPTALGVLEGKPVMILSGNPVAAVVGFETFARPLISRLLGLRKDEERNSVKAKLTRKIATALGRKNFVRVRVFLKNDDFFAEPISAKGSGAISTLTRSNGFVIVPENREGLSEGELVTVRLFGTVEDE